MVKFLCSDEEDLKFKLLNDFKLDSLQRAYIMGQFKIINDITGFGDFLDGLADYKLAEIDSKKTRDKYLQDNKDVFQAVVEGKTHFN